jgi:dynein heavy chain
MTTSPRIQWMVSMLKSCFHHNLDNDEKVFDAKELAVQLLDFLMGKTGQTCLVYYQKPMKVNDRNEKIDSSIHTIYVNQSKNVELKNRAAFFIRMLPEGREFSTAQLQNGSDNELYYGEISTDSMVSMTKVIHNYLYQGIENFGGEEWGEIEPEQKQEFKKILEQFAKDMNDTVESLIKGVKFVEIPQHIKDSIAKDNNRDFMSNEDSNAVHTKIEEIYRSWIETLSSEIEDMDKEPPFGDNVGPKSELEKWKFRLQRLTKVNDFFKCSDFRLISKYFGEPRSKQSQAVTNLVNDMKQKKTDAHTAQAEAKDNVKYLSTLEIYFDPLYNGTPDTIIDSLQSLMNSLKLISFTARYYDNTKMTTLFSRITDQMIINCKDYILDRKKNSANEDPTYVWERNPDELINKFKTCIRLNQMYREKYKEAKSNSTSTNKENNFEFGDHQLFGKFDSFCKRLTKLIELFTTIKQFEDIKRHKLDSMESIENKYDDQLETFKQRTGKLLEFQKTQFDKDYVAFNLAISEIENELHKIINEEFKKVHWIDKKLKLLTKYEKILTKSNLQANLKSEKIEIYSNYKREIDSIQINFESGRQSPKIQRNIPKISGKIKWAKHLFNRIYPYINNFKDINIKERQETELSYMTTNTLLYSYIILNEKFFEQFVESAKAKLSAPLLVFTENSEPRVNLDLYVLQLIREAKCMVRMNCNIPETAKIILLQEEKFKNYYNELNFLVKEYKRILSRMGRNEADNYFKAHIKDLNLKLHPLKTTINWSSMNIDSNLTGVFQCIQRIEYAIDAFYEVLENRVHRNMISIKKLELLHIIENPTSKTITDIIKKQEEYVNEKNSLLLSKNSEIENAILDIIDGIKSYSLDPKIPKVEDKILYKLIADYEDKFYDFLMTTTKNSLINLKEKISGKESIAIFKVDVILSNNQIEISPKISVIQEAINKLAKSILYAMKGISSWKKLDSDDIVSFHTKIGKDNEIVKMILLLTGSVQSNNNEIEKYLKESFDPFKTLWMDSIEKKIKEFNNKKNKTYFDYEEKLIEYTNIEKAIKDIPEDFNKGAINLNSKSIKSTLEYYCNEWKNAYSKELLRKTRSCAKELNEIIKNFDIKLRKKPEKIEELKEMVDTIEEIRQKEGEIEMQIKPFVQLYNLVKVFTKESDFERFNFPTKNDFETNWRKVVVNAAMMRDDLQSQQTNFKRRLYMDIQKLKDEVSDLKKEYDLNGPTKGKNPIDAHERIEKYRMRTVILNKAWTNIKNGEKLFNLSNTEYPQLREIEDELKIYGTLYDLYMEVIKQVDAWKDLQFVDVKENLEEMQKKDADLRVKLNKVNKKLVTTPEYESLKEQINIVGNTIEALVFLNEPVWEEHHWKEISEMVNVKEAQNTKSDGGLFKLKLLWENNLYTIKNNLEDLLSVAVNQSKIKDNLDKIDDYWKTSEFKFQEHNRKEISVLETTSFFEIKLVLEENAGKIATYKSQARNLTSDLQTRIKAKESQFQNILNCMELWYTVQSLWGSLQSFFIGGDIRKDLPGPTKQFELADKDWVKLMEKAVSTKNCVALCSGNELTPVLTEIDGILKICQKNLDNYLENKRGAFPRFYFVSNSVLLEILSKRSEPGSIKSNLNIIFDAITDIEFSELEKKTIIKIKQTKGEGNSKDIQEVNISKYPVKCDGKIEDWLNELVRSMQESIRDLFEKSYFDVKQFFDGTIEQNRESFLQFILRYICQVSLFSLQILGTKKLEEFVIKTSASENLKKKLLEKSEKCAIDADFYQIQSVIAELCRRDLGNKLEVVKLETLIVVQVHSRDIYDFILKHKDGKITINDYDWLKQTRVYWYNQNKIRTCLINITDVPFEYGYEFLGAKERMCITELTDKCYITLAQAMGMNYGGAPAGPAGTGKTETVKDMGRTMGVFVLVTNCAPEHRYADMALIFKGLCKSGAWGCFDEFNRIHLEVLSVLATIVSAIQEARKLVKASFKFPDSSKNPNSNPECELMGTTAYFITMNPGYAGRQELPENLKVLFRGVCMMVPDRQAIIRVKLCSFGFDNNDDLSKKFAKLYYLCEDQLSKQKHYDFGLRNILSVLRHAGNVKKKVREVEKEEEILYLALKGMNESKFVPDDIELFKSLIEDVFPSQRNTKPQEYPDLEAKFRNNLALKGLDKDRAQFIKKIVQTFETVEVRHSFMLVGVTGTGKTTILEILTESLSEGKEAKYKTIRMNPKAIEEPYLFIQKKLDVYILGVFTMIWKRCNEASSMTTKGNNWLVCDGPIDSIWIESLNTVMDDNKILTLSNNDRINMADTCRLVFECEDLRNATLATVSRAGMIYITEEDITYRPYIVSWFIKNKDIFKDQKNKESEYLRELIEKKYFTDAFILEININKNLNICMKTSWLIRIKNFLLLIEALLISKKDILDKAFLEKVVIFAITWSVGSLYEHEQRKVFHEILRNLCKAPIPEINGDITIFEMTIENNTWEPWRTEETNLRKSFENFSNLLIPTMDSTRAIFLIERVASVKIDSSSEKTHPCLLLGDAGTAKTSTILLYKNKFDEKKVLKRVNFSSATTPTNFQETCDEEFEKSGNIFVPTCDKNLTLFIDDISMPFVNKWGDQITLELVRQFLEFGGYYLIGDADNRGIMKKIEKISFVAAMNHPKGGKNDIPNRLKRHFFIFNMVLPSEASINDIYGKIIDIFFTPKAFGDTIALQAKKLTKLTSDLLKKVKNKFITTPIKFHYSFNMRDLSRTFQGIFLIDREGLKLSQSRFGIAPEILLFSLWRHESSRVFSDKLRDIEDKQEYKNIVNNVLSDNLDKEICENLQEERLFTDYMRPSFNNEEWGKMEYPKAYELIKTMDALRDVTHEYILKLKEEKKLKHVDLVLFDDCLKYLIKLIRIIQTPQGSAMLVGVGGSGKQSITRLAAWCSQQKIIQLGSDRADKLEELKIEFRSIYQTMVGDYNPSSGKFLIRHTFCMTDNEIKLESFLELISSFLSTGEIANLFSKKEDKLAITSLTRAMLSKKKEFANATLDENQVLVELINTVRDNLHMSLCFSPSSDKFREKFIKFPVLFNSCTIIWLLPWPESALISVATGFFKAKKNLVVDGKPEHVNQLYNLMGSIHNSIQIVCEMYAQKMKRFVYVTPKSYLSFIEEYIKIYAQKKQEILSKESIINNGLSKLDEASEDIKAKNKILEVKMQEVEAIKKDVIEQEQALAIEVDKVRKIDEEVSAEANKCNKEAEQISAEANKVQNELNEAQPKLDDAKKKMSMIDKNAIVNLSGGNVPYSIRFYWDCVALVIGKRLKIIEDFGDMEFTKAKPNEKNTILSYNLSFDLIKLYNSSQEIYNIIQSWLKKLEGGKTLTINDETLELIKPYLQTTLNGSLVFDDEKARGYGGDNGSKLAGFCRAVGVYMDAVKEVIPKQNKVEKKLAELSEAQRLLKIQMDKLDEVRKKKEALEETVNEVRKKKEEQEEIADRMKKQVDNATNLIMSLSGERSRWIEDSKKFEQNKMELLGNAAICSAFIAYSGPFNFEFRSLLIKDFFKGEIDRRGCPYSSNLDIESFLADDSTKGEWAMNKLPSDTISVQNGILVTSSSRFPLLIDPQNQAKTWLLTTFPEIETNKYIFSQKFIAAKFDYLDACLANGDQIIVEGIENDVESKLEPILEKQILPSTSKIKKLMVGDKVKDFCETFKMYLLCKLINPHFSPELAAKTTIIDFNVTISGLEQQLQGIVVSKEQKILEETLKNIMADITKNKNSLVQCQKDILDNLNKPGNLLENAEIIVVLNNSKIRSEENNKKIKEAEDKKEDINLKRLKYLPVATRGSVLYFSIVDIQEISKMYSTSLQQFTDLFEYSIANAIPNNHTETRVKNIVQKLSDQVYKYVNRGLFERDKTAFILIVCFKVLTVERIEGNTLLNQADINLFIKCGGIIMPDKEEDCPFDFLTKTEKKPKEWLNLLAIHRHKFNGSLNCFSKLLDKIRDNPEKMKNFFNTPDAENFIPYEDLFNQSNPKLVAFLKLIFIRCFRDDRACIAACQQFVPIILDNKDFLNPFSETMDDIYNISKNRIPILYLLSAGADPSTSIEELARKRKKTINRVSMGENQEETAQTLVDYAKDSGEWVLLQNCHLGLIYMQNLDILLKNTDINFNPETRIFLSCEPRDSFPIGLLHQSLKITNEPPKGIKASMIKTFSTVVNQDLLDNFEFKEWRSLIFTLSFMHSLVLERRKYGPLGWCIPYEFNNSDLESSILFVYKQFQKGFEVDDKAPPRTMINFKTLINVVSTILYGGRITDRKDGELFKTIIASYLDDSFFTKGEYSFYPPNNAKNDPKYKDSPVYKAPDEALPNMNQINNIINHITTFSKNDPPQVFGLHGSADLTFRLKEFKELLDTISSTLPKEGGGGGGISKEEDVKNRVVIMLQSIPEEFAENEYRTKIDNLSWGSIGRGLNVPLHNVLLQEIIRVQGIINLVKTSLIDIREALEGRLMMTSEIVAAIDALYLTRPPHAWMFNANSEEISWLSPTVASWYEGLKVRSDRLREWMNSSTNSRPAFYLTGFLNPQGFIAAFKQEVFKLKKATIPGLTLDAINIKFEPDKIETDPKTYMLNDKKRQQVDKSSSMIIHGLYLEGAIWAPSGNLEDNIDQNSRDTVTKFPVINCIGIADDGKPVAGTQGQIYKCPVYKYPKRTDKYFIIEINLKTPGNDKDDKFWQKRGVALLCNKE